ncbi:thioredoxin-like protein, partial [Hysterangium stoloniferum]
IAQSTIVIFSKSWCPYCAYVICIQQLLVVVEVTFVVRLDTMNEGADIQSYLHSKTGQRTVPNIFIKQQHIGGEHRLHSHLFYAIF